MDNDLLVINKPSGILTIPDGYDPSVPYLRSLLEPTMGRLWVIHRLDKDTSGVIILARNKAAHRYLSLQFENRLVNKTYHAIVVGSPPWHEIVVDIPLLVNGDRQHRTVPAQLTGKPAATSICVLERFADYSLIEASPKTGYTHQIRAHLSATGFPILADDLYGMKQGLRLIPIQRLALHAERIQFTHPVGEKQMDIAAPYICGFSEALDWLKVN